MINVSNAFYSGTIFHHTNERFEPYIRVLEECSAELANVFNSPKLKS